MILTDIQIQSLIVCAALLLAVILVGYTMIRMEIREEREKRKRIVRRLNHERNYGRER
ncbi:MAG: hypothetical protein IIW36_04390 [Clostridia bacterium]|nr:hypothetical protein [Clostridia bacterium]